MAAYAALVSLNFIIDQVPHSLFPDKSQIQSLENKIEFLEKFLEDYSPGSGKETSFQALEIEIRDVSNAAEDMIESYVLDQTVLKQARDKETNSSTILFSEDLRKVMEELESINEKAMKIKDVDVAAKGQQPQSSSPPGGAARSAPRSEDNSMVGFDEHLVEIMDLITSDESDLRILPIVGMPGIGKTTLIRNVFDNQLIKDHFRICIWGSISQTYNLQEIYLSFLHDVGIVDQQDLDPNELGLKLYKSLSATRYLVILDDVWSVEVWDKLKTFFPDNGEGNRVIITTRLLSVASDIGSYDPYELEFLNKDESWNLLKQKVFAEDECPSMLEDVGKDIAVSCRGLPLAIVVIAGQLVKSNMTRKSWEYVAGALSSLVNSGDDDHCLKILSLSYDNLPVYLKPCFLYMGAFPEDSEVRVSTLVKLWVAEGFLKTIGDKSLEECAMEYLKDLFERHLILVSKRASSGNFKTIRVHDLLRDLCLREAHKQNLLCVKRFHSFYVPHGLQILPGSNCIYRTVSKSISHNSLPLNPIRSASLELSSLKLLSELNVPDVNSFQKNLLLIGSRCLTLSAQDVSISLASLSKLWSLQSLVMRRMLRNKPIVLPWQIWEMSQLRHLEIPKAFLQDPPRAKLFFWKAHALENLQTLQDVHNFNITSEVLRRIPNLKKLKLTYTESYKGAGWPFSDSHCRVQLVELCKLESLSLLMHIKILMAHLSFPRSLKKFTLDGGEIPWEDISILGQLPYLVVLRLRNSAFCGTKWTTAEGEFLELKSLHLENVSLENWDSDSCSHFPNLESLFLRNVWRLKGIPPCFEESTRLQSMSFVFCSTSIVDSAKQINVERETFGNSSIQVKERLTCETRDGLIVELEKDLRQLKAFLPNLLENRTDNYKLARQMQDMLDEAEDVIDIFLTPQVTENHFYKLYEMAKDVEFQLEQLSKDYSPILPAVGQEIYKRSEPIVGFEDEAKFFVDQLTRVYDKLQTSSIIGMPGLGKTAFAWKIFEHQTIRFEFPVRIWVNVSQDLNMRKVLLDILSNFTATKPDISVTEADLIAEVRGHLEAVKFLIVMDDIWTIDTWKKLKALLPMGNKWGSVLVTTRHKDVGNNTSNQLAYNLRFLTLAEGWELLRYKVFNRIDDVPEELVGVGEDIVMDCQRLPLSIIVIGGILERKTSLAGDNIAAKMNEWKKVSYRVKSFLIERDKKYLLGSIISLSYDTLPYELKICFLYLGVFPEDADIPVKKLIRLWIAERFVPEIRGMRLEEVAHNYLKELINRNLVMVRKAKFDGEAKICHIRDSVRKICQRKGGYGKLNLYQEVSKSEPCENISKFRRVSIHSHTVDFFSKKPELLKARSFLCFNEPPLTLETKEMASVTDNFVLLRVYDAKNIKFPRFPPNFVRQVTHLRYLTLSVADTAFKALPEIVTDLWNLQTLIVEVPSPTLDVKGDLLKMRQLRHFKTRSSIIFKKIGEGEGNDNLQTLSRLSPESCTPEVCRKAKALLTLVIQGNLREFGQTTTFRDLDSLKKLKLVHTVPRGETAEYPWKHIPASIGFPPELKIVVLSGTHLDWSSMSIFSAIGSLEVLKLKENAFHGDNWDVAGSGFAHLVCLQIERANLKGWTASAAHFPKLRFLYISNCEKLCVIPASLGKKLELLSLKCVGIGAVNCAKAIHEEEQNNRKRLFRLKISVADNKWQP